MSLSTRLLAITTAFAIVATATVSAQNSDEADVAKAATKGEKLLDPKDLKWNKDLQWINFVVSEGGVQAARGYFGAITKEELATLVSGGGTGMLKVQQCFYFNNSTRSFSRFDAPQPGASVSLYEKNAYFRQDTIVRVVPLNRQFVENLAVRKFLNVAGE